MRLYHRNKIDGTNYSPIVFERKEKLDKIRILLNEGCSEAIALGKIGFCSNSIIPLFEEAGAFKADETKYPKIVNNPNKNWYQKDTYEKTPYSRTYLEQFDDFLNGEAGKPYRDVCAQIYSAVKLPSSKTANLPPIKRPASVKGWIGLAVGGGAAYYALKQPSASHDLTTAANFALPYLNISTASLKPATLISIGQKVAGFAVLSGALMSGKTWVYNRGLKNNDQLNSLASKQVSREVADQRIQEIFDNYYYSQCLSLSVLQKISDALTK